MWDELGITARRAMLAQLALLLAWAALAESRPLAIAAPDLGHDRQALIPVASGTVAAQTWVGAPPHQPVAVWPPPPTVVSSLSMEA